MYGTDNRIMLTLPDPKYLYRNNKSTGPTFYQVCYRIVYTSTTGEVENGGGTLSGRRYYQYIVTNKCKWVVTYMASSFNLAQVSWTQNNLTVENPPDLGTMELLVISICIASQI